MAVVAVILVAAKVETVGGAAARLTVIAVPLVAKVAVANCPTGSDQLKEWAPLRPPLAVSTV